MDIGIKKKIVNIRCFFGYHVPHRRAGFDGTHFIGECMHCELVIEKKVRKGRWKKLDLDEFIKRGKEQRND